MTDVREAVMGAAALTLPSLNQPISEQHRSLVALSIFTPPGRNNGEED